MKKLLLLLAAALLPCRPAFAWGCKGHETVALIAAAHLTPAVAERVNAILAASPVAAGNRRGCGADAAGLPPIATVASWADDVRDATTGPYHYIDIPFAAKKNTVTLNRACNDSCVTFAIAKYSLQLIIATDPRDRADALRFLIHFVGDIQQPLHAIDNADHGGNCVPVNFPGNDRPTNLHSIWDSAILGSIISDPDAVQYAAALDTHFGAEYAQGSTKPEDWAWESHALAIKNAYGPLPIKVAADLEPAPNYCSDRRQPLPMETIDAAYIAQARPVIELQLDKGGQRLARLLNHLLAQPPTH